MGRTSGNPNIVQIARTQTMHLCMRDSRETCCWKGARNAEKGCKEGIVQAVREVAPGGTEVMDGNGSSGAAFRPMCRIADAEVREKTTRRSAHSHSLNQKRMPCRIGSRVCSTTQTNPQATDVAFVGCVAVPSFIITRGKTLRNRNRGAI